MLTSQISEFKILNSDRFFKTIGTKYLKNLLENFKMAKTDHVYEKPPLCGNKLKYHKNIPKKWKNYETETPLSSPHTYIKGDPKWNNCSIAWTDLWISFLLYYINFILWNKWMKAMDSHVTKIIHIIVMRTSSVILSRIGHICDWYEPQLRFDRYNIIMLIWQWNIQFHLVRQLQVEKNLCFAIL